MTYRLEVRFKAYCRDWVTCHLEVRFKAYWRGCVTYRLELRFKAYCRDCMTYRLEVPFKAYCRDCVTYRLEVRFKAYWRGWVMALYLSKLMTQRLTILAVQHITSMDTQKSQNLRPNLHPPAKRHIETLAPRSHRTSAQISTHPQRET